MFRQATIDKVDREHISLRILRHRFAFREFSGGLISTHTILHIYGQLSNSDASADNLYYQGTRMIVAHRCGLP